MQGARVEIVLELIADAPQNQLQTLAAPLPTARQRRREVRRLRWAQAVEGRRRSDRFHPCVRQARTRANRPRTVRPLRETLEAAYDHPVDVLALPERPASRDETHLGKDARSGPQSHVRDGILQAI